MTGPVDVDGTIFSVDDTDAAQGDGEGYEVTTGMGPDLMTGPCAAVSEMLKNAEPELRLFADRCLHAVRRVRRSP